MAKQDGIIQMTGTIGNLSFYKTRDGYFVRKKAGISRARVKSDPAFARTRENAMEFAQAARAGKLLRRAFQPLMMFASDSRVTSRLAGTLVKVVRADTAHPKGQRVVTAQNTTLLNDFNFNRHGSLHKTFLADYTASIDHTTNSFTVYIPSFKPSEKIWAPPGATHFRLTACGASIDFESGTYKNAISRSTELTLNATIPEFSLSGSISGDKTCPIFLALSVEFLQEVNGQMSSMNNQAHNAMAIVGVNGEADTRTTPAQGIDRKPCLTRHAPKKRPHVDRIPIARPSKLTPVGLPLPIRSIVAEVLESPATLDRIIGDRKSFNELSHEGRAALGLFRLSTQTADIESSASNPYADKVRDGP